MRTWARCLMTKLAELYPMFRRFFADSDYERSRSPERAKLSFGKLLNVVKRQGDKGFLVL